MTIPLPPEGSTSWYAHYAQLDTQARDADARLDTLEARAPVVVLTQAAYNALTPAAGTVYVISG